MYQIQLNLMRSLGRGQLTKCLRSPSTLAQRAFSRTQEIYAQKDKLTRFDESQFVNDAPLKFRGSGGDSYRSHETFIIRSGRPKSQGMILSAALGVFLLYFFVLREENDVDDRLGLSMLESVPQEYEVEVLKMARQMVLNEGGSTEELDQRLRELQEEKLVSNP